MRRWAVLAGVLILAVDAAYVWGVALQGGGDGTLRAAFIGAFLAACGVAAVAGGVIPPAGPRLVLLSFSAAGMVILGVLAIFSIGLALIAISVPLALAAGRSAVSPLPRVAVWLGGAALALLVIVGGLWATEFPATCPATGGSSGSGVGFLTGDYHWTCANGKLTTGAGLCQSGSTSVAPDGHVIVTSGC